MVDATLQSIEKHLKALVYIQVLRMADEESLRGGFKPESIERKNSAKQKIYAKTEYIKDILDRIYKAPSLIKNEKNTDKE